MVRRARHGEKDGGQSPPYIFHFPCHLPHPLLRLLTRQSNTLIFVIPAKAGIHLKAKKDSGQAGMTALHCLIAGLIIEEDA
jgi:hypothetical protein